MDKITEIKKTDVTLAFLIALAIMGLTLLWFSFDYRFPSQDEAEHIINSIAFRDLWAAARPWRLHWWYQCLTVNSFYPPFVYMINGLFLLIFGQSRFVEQLAISFFTGLMVIAVYVLTRLLSGTRVVASIAAVCICMYPAITTLSHSFFLDLPEVAMLALALMTLLWWRSKQNLKWWHTILTAIVLGMACLSKQLVAAYLIPVGLYFLISDSGLGFPLRKTRTKWLGHILLMGVVTALIGLPFILINYESSKGLTATLIRDTAAKHIHFSYLEKLNAYVHLLLPTMSPFLLVVFLVAVLFLWRRNYLSPVAISALGGLSIICAMPGFGLDYRYLAPFLIAPAIYTGFFIGELFVGKKIWQQIAAATICLIALANYLFFNFVPYPLSLPQLPWQTRLSEYKGNPTEPNDWGLNLVLDTIEKTDKDKLVYLNVLTNMGTLHGHAFDLLLKERGNTYIKPTSSRFFTIVGDKVQFSPETALNYQWFLWKTGAVGYYFYDKESEQNFKRLIEFVRSGGQYKLMLEKVLPDGSELMLYRRKS